VILVSINENNTSFSHVLSMYGLKHMLMLIGIWAKYYQIIVLLVTICPIGSVHCFSSQNLPIHILLSEIFTVCECGMEINFQSSVSVCLVRVLAFESFDLKTLFLVCRYIFRMSRSDLYIKVIRSKLQDQKTCLHVLFLTLTFQCFSLTYKLYFYTQVHILDQGLGITDQFKVI